MKLLKLFSKSSSIEREQDKLFFALEKIVNIARVKTERGDNQSVKDILNDLELIFKKFWQLRKDNPAKFEFLLWSKDFFDKYVKPIKPSTELVNDKTENTKSDEELKQAASLELAFSPEEKLLGLTRFLNSFEKIWESAYHSNNEEISRYVVYHINWLLAELVLEEGNDLFVEQYLKTLFHIAWKGISETEKGKRIDASLYAATTHWYIDIVFNRLRAKEQEFSYTYLNVLDRYFTQTIHYIISEEQTILFQSFVSLLVDGIHIRSARGKIWDYGHILLRSDLIKYNELNNQFQIEDQIRKLSQESNSIDSKEKLELVLEKINRLQEILEPNLTKEQEIESWKIKEEVKQYVHSQYKYNNLLEIAFEFGAYCLFKNRLYYIKYLWEYKQPPDSDAIWVGHDITQNTVEEVLNFYFGKRLYERESDRWENRHGSQKYFRYYFIALLLRAIKNHGLVNGKIKTLIDNYKIPDWNIHIIRGLEYYVDNLIETINKFEDEKEIVALISQKSDEYEQIKDMSILVLEKVKEKARERIMSIERTNKISDKKVEEFKTNVSESFYNNIVIRDIIQKHIGQYIDSTKNKVSEKFRRIGTNTIFDKAAFFEEWYSDYGKVGEAFGSELAYNEDYYILDAISKACVKQKKENIEILFEETEDISDLILLSTQDSFYKYFEDNVRYKPKWHNDPPSSPIELQSFAGWFEFDKKYIPVFSIFFENMQNRIWILYKSKIGKLEQYSPLDENESPDLIKDIFFINVQAFSENENLLNEFLKNPPSWLQEIGNENKQKEYLQEKVLIHILERFQYNTENEFVGYTVDI